MQRVRYRVDVLGCKVNQAEARQMEERLCRAGYVPTESGETPDLIVLHTCAVTAEAQRKSAQTMRRLRQQYPDARLALSGCGAAGLPGDANTDGLLPPSLRIEPAEALAGWIPPLSGAPIRKSVLPSYRIREFIKIQDGCDLTCAYCIVRVLRGPSRDRSPDAIVEEARKRLDHGCRELVVSGISAGLYGRTPGRPSLPDLLTRLAGLPGLLRLRISSLHPAELTPDVLRTWADLESVLMPHLHLPLQSGSDRVLRLMRRGYTRRTFMLALDRVRKALRDPAIHTDLIAGFPGESEEDAGQTEQFCREAGFQRMHVFPFSARPGTEAATLPDPVPPRLLHERAGRLRALSNALWAETQQKKIGQTVLVLVESRRRRDNALQGYSERYDVVRFAGSTDQMGQLIPVRITGTSPTSLTGDAVEDSPSVTAAVSAHPTAG